MKKILLLSTLALGLPFAAFASTYSYVNTAGAVQSVQADNATDAFALATNIAPHSGVALDMGTFVSPGDPTYEYVNTRGAIVMVNADNAADAFAEAVNIAPHSGVALVTP